MSIYSIKRKKWQITGPGFALVFLMLFVFSSLGFARMRELPKSFTMRLKLKSLTKVELKALPAINMAKIKKADSQREADRSRPIPYRYAVGIDTNLTLENAGTWETLTDGSRLWRLQIRSHKATSLSLGITRFDLPEGVKLWIYNPAGDYVEGPYTAKHRSKKGRLWTPLIIGDQITVEVYIPSGTAGKPVVEIGKVSHGYRKLTGPDKGSGDQGACNIDVICPAGNPWQDEIRSVAHFTFFLQEGNHPCAGVVNAEDEGFYGCTGQLVNNTAGDFTPYFLTACHCRVVPDTEDTVVLYWNYQSPNCGDHGGGSHADSQTGVTFRASYTPSDFRLLELDSPPDPDYDVYYAGWDATGAAPASSVCIHHPIHGEKSISFDNDPATSTAYLSDTVTPTGDHWRIAIWNAGTTEGGSSGAGLWDTTSHLIVGQLHGGGAACSGSDPNNLPDWFGKLSVSWTGGGTAATRLQDWLDPVGGGATLQFPGAEPPAGTGPIMRLQSTLLDFGDVELEFAFTKAIVVYNDGDAPLTVSVANQPTGDESHWAALNETTNHVIAAGGDPLILLQVYEPAAVGTHTTQSLVTGDDPANPSQTVILTGECVSPTPFDTVLVLDRSYSMTENAGDRQKIDAMRDAADLYAHLLRIGAGDKIGLVKYNQSHQEYLALEAVDDPGTPGSHMNILETQKLSDDALTDLSRIKPSGSTGIGGAMARAAGMLLAAADGLRHVLVVITDGKENEIPYINTVIGPIQAADPHLQMYSVGVGSDIEPTKLQDISNIGNGYHQIADDLSGVDLFALETFYFKIFANAAGMALAVDPTYAVPAVGKKPIVVSRALITSSDREAIFLVLDIPQLRSYYTLELVAPNGQVITPSSVVGGASVHYLRRHTYTLYRIKLPRTASQYSGSWVLRLTPKGVPTDVIVKNEKKPKSFMSMDRGIGLVPVGFAAATASNYRMSVAVLPESRLPGASVLLTATATDRGWPVRNARIFANVTTPHSRITQRVRLYDNGTHGDITAGDGTYTGRFIQTEQTGSYRFIFRSIGSNHRGEIAMREADRYLTVGTPTGKPVDPKEQLRRGLSVHMGVTFPTGALSSSYDSSYMYGVNLEYRLRPRFSLVGFLGYNHFRGASPMVSDTHWWNLSANFKFQFGSGILRPYLNGGGGIYIPHSGDAKPGFNLGFGVDRTLTQNLTLETGIDYHHIITSLKDPTFFTGHLGLIFRF